MFNSREGFYSKSDQLLNRAFPPTAEDLHPEDFKVYRKPFKTMLILRFWLSERSCETSKLKRIVGFHWKNNHFVKVAKFNIFALARRFVKDQKARFADVRKTLQNLAEIDTLGVLGWLKCVILLILH